jgi:predicted Rossmann fold nucleotide-binding protein DprA/Smf involved in DNA uptake
MNANLIDIVASEYPPFLRNRLDGHPLPGLSYIGKLEILEKRLMAWFCSSRCPGEVVLRTYDLARTCREQGVVVVSGFHSRMEKEVFRFLVRGSQPIVVCPARSLHRMRLPSGWREALSQDRLLVISPFCAGFRRLTARLARERNRFVAQLADEIFVAHAAAGGKTEELCQWISSKGKPCLTIDCSENGELIAMGARCIETPDVSPRVT